MGEIMCERWVEATLRDVATLRGGYAFKSATYSSTGRYRVITIGNVQSGYFDISATNCVDEIPNDLQKHQRLLKGDILVSMTGNVGRTCLVDRDDCLLNQRVGKLEPRNAVTAQYLYWLLHLPWLINTLTMRAKGGAQGNISVNDVLSLPVKVAPLPEQHRIVDLMGAVDAYVAAADARVEAARTARTALLTDLLSTPGDDWAETTLGEVCAFAGGYAFSDRFQGANSGEVPFFKVSDMNTLGNELILTSANNWVSETVLKEMRAKAWPPGTVVFPKVGAALLTEKRRALGCRAAFDNNVMGVIAGDQVLPEFLLAFMQSVRLGSLAQIGAVPSVNQSHVASVPLVLPPLPEQLRIVDLVGAVDGEIETSEKLAAEARTLRTALLTDLLSGTHEIPSSYDRLLEAA